MKRSAFKRKPDSARLRQRRALHASKSAPKNPVVCEACGETFKVYPYRISVAKTCSYKCKGKLMRTRVLRTCRTCGDEFDFAPSQLNRYSGAGKYCSPACSYKGYVALTRLKPIKDKYQRSHRKDDKAWQLAVRLKDDCTCQRCGKQEPYIHTHHVAPRSRRPDLKHEVSNGKCLCNSCHSWVHLHPIEATKAGLLSDASYEKRVVTGIRSDNSIITYRGLSLPAFKWAQHLGLNANSLRCRKRRGWDDTRIIETPVKGCDIPLAQMKQIVEDMIADRKRAA